MVVRGVASFRTEQPGFKPWSGALRCALEKDTTLTLPLLTQGRVFRKSVNANPGLKVNRANNFFSIKILSTACALCSLIAHAQN